jgi:2-polyprenyl-6-methoxyphenol hydroxylase-like FAD-dependent oxidoreductase
MTADIDTDVLVVGAGPSGLSTAIVLARHGVSCRVVERDTGSSDHPKARGVRIRTMELFRQWGLEERLRRSALPPEARRFIYCDSLTGAEIGRSPELDDDDERHSPTTSCRVAQDAVEASLLDLARSRPEITMRFGSTMTGFDQDGDGVTVAVTAGDGEPLTIRARYLVAADGVASGTRKLLGIPMEGIPLIAYWQSVYWRADISALVSHRPCIQYLTGARAGHPADIGSVDGTDRWVTMVSLPPSAERPEPLSDQAAVAVVRRAVGDPDLDVRVVNTATWRLSAQVAAQWAAGRVFLVGDAAHSFPPTGGFGMNTGVQDAHNLAWKLAYVLRGVASPRLLDTYGAERRPVAQARADWSVANGARFREIRAAITAGDLARFRDLVAGQREHLLALEQDLGVSYTSAAVVPDGTFAAAHPDGGFTPTARPGVRAPHVWLDRDRRISTLDLYDLTFVLLSTSEKWVAQARGTGLPMESHLVGNTAIAEAYGLGEHGAVVIRPDGHVAWRTTCTADAAESVVDVLRKVLGWRP